MPFSAAIGVSLYATHIRSGKTSARNLMRGFGRLLQMAGLVLLPLASLMQLSGTISVGQMLQMLALGICAFGIGWILTTYRL
jgi:hypothetical protein